MWTFSNYFTFARIGCSNNKIEIIIVWASQVVLVVKNPPTNARDVRDIGSILVLGKSLGGGHGIPLQYFCLKNPMDREPGGLPPIGSQKVGHD